MEKFYLLLVIQAESREQAEEYQESYAGSNDGSELIANAQIMRTEELKAVVAGM
jgi:hypothetical protein